MPVSDHDDLEVDEHVLPRVRWTWGMDFAPDRRWTDGWGSSIEVPAVIELLDLIAAGSVDAGRVRQALVGRADELDAEYDPKHGNPEAQKYARCFGDCDACQAAEAGFRRHLAESQARVAKALDTERYPYVVNGRTAHHSACRHAAPERWHRVMPSGHELQIRLKAYAHGQGASSYEGEALDWDGLMRWVQANVGPQGGRYYRACKVCKPQLP